MSINCVNHLKQTSAPKKSKLEYKFGLVVTNFGITKHSIENGEMLDGIWLDDDAIIKTTTEILTASQNNVDKRTFSDDLTITPENVLINNNKIIVWHTETNLVTNQWYNSSDRVISVNNVPHPKLIFIAPKNEHKLYIVATKNNVIRPSLDTPIFHAPLANMYNGMNLCIGSALYPERKVENLKSIEETLFFSRYNHFKFANINLENKDKKLDFTLKAIKFWQSLENKPTFPDNLLVKNDSFVTLHDILKSINAAIRG